jgi:predicted permease
MFAFTFVKRKMTDQGICGKCSQRDSCKEVYQQMADNKGPSVLGKVLIAFAVPLLSFVSAVAVFSGLTTKIIPSEWGATTLSFFLAVGTAILVVAVTQVVNRRFGKYRQN